MTAPGLFRWGKKSSNKAASDTLQCPHSRKKPELIFPKGLSRRTSNETFPDSSSHCDSSVVDSVASSADESPRRVVRRMTLQARLDSHLKSRGHSTETRSSAETAYLSIPSPLQQASYSVALQDVDPRKLREMLRAGISANPVSAQGDSYLHWVCRNGRNDLLQVLIENGCRLQTCNIFGRTPLHEACWSRRPNFELVSTILKHDPMQLYMADIKGLLPLAYVRRELRQEWMEFIDKEIGLFFPASFDQKKSSLLELKPNSRLIPDPAHALTPQVAEMVASMIMDPHEAVCLQYEKKDENEDLCDAYREIEDHSESNFSLDENELSEILTLMSVPASA